MVYVFGQRKNRPQNKPRIFLCKTRKFPLFNFQTNLSYFIFFGSESIESADDDVSDDDVTIGRSDESNKSNHSSWEEDDDEQFDQDDDSSASSSSTDTDDDENDSLSAIEMHDITVLMEKCGQ
jgi:hypothetical protein